jgi:glutamate synthase domain-containing protein 2
MAPSKSVEQILRISPGILVATAGRCDVADSKYTLAYSASVLNVSTMTFGALSASAILALNTGAKHGGVAHSSGDGGFIRLGTMRARGPSY